MKRIYKTIIKEFIYDSLEEKTNHKEEMEMQGYQDSGQVKKDINQSFSNPDYKWYGKYVMYE